MIDKVDVCDAASLGIWIATHWYLGPVVEVNQASVSMVRSKVKFGKKVRAKDGLTDVGDNESKIKFSIFDPNLAVIEAVAGDIGPIGCLKLPSIWARRSLLGSGRDDGPVCTAID